MKLLKCYIENFGKLNNFTYKFEEGLNIINQNNGFGKTTFANFIKAMFYGLESTAKRTSALTDRKKYAPWQGGNFGGNLEFEINQKKYKVERYFGKKEQEDTFKLYDLNTNLESKDFTNKLGEEIFKINKEAYERSTYIPQQKIQIKMNDSLNAKLGNILESENDINTSEKAIKNLAEAIKIYKKTGDRGLIDIEKNNILVIKKKLENIKNAEKNIEEREKKLAKINTEITEKENIKKELQNKITEIIDLSRKSAKLETYTTILNKYNKSKEELEKVNNFFKNEIPKDAEIEELTEKCLTIEKYKIECKNNEISEENKAKLKKLSLMYKNKDINDEKIKTIISNYNECTEIKNNIDTIYLNKKYCENELQNLKKQQILKNKIFEIFTILGLILMMIIVVCVFFNKKLMLIVLGIPALLFIITGLINKNKKDKIQKIYNTKKSEKEKLEKTIKNLINKKDKLEGIVKQFVEEFSDLDNERDILIKLTEIKSKYNKYNDLNNVLNEQLESLFITKNKKELLEKSIEEYLKQYFEIIDKPYTKLAEEIKIKKNEYNSLKIEYEENKKQKELFEKNNNLDELKDQNIENKKIQSQEKLEELLNNADKQINILNDEKNYIKNQIESMKVDVDNIDDIKQELEEKTQKLKILSEKYKVLETTKKMLEKSKEKFSSLYINKMEEGYNKYIKLIDSSNLNTSIDVNLNTKIDYMGSKKDTEYMSTGYQDLIYLCMRFSLISALFKEEKPFIILDDPFVNLDKEKTEKSLELIKKVANEYQIIYFICHNSRS